MRRFCSVNRCTRVAAWVLVFDAERGMRTVGTPIRVRAEVHACETHRDELAVQVDAYDEVPAEALE